LKAVSGKNKLTDMFNFFTNLMKMDANKERLVFFVLIFLSGIHVTSCLWIYICWLDDFGPDCWIVKAGLVDESIFVVNSILKIFN